MRKTLVNLRYLKASLRCSSKLLVSSLFIGLLSTGGTTTARAEPSMAPLVAFNSTATTKSVSQRLVGQWQTKNPSSGETVKLIFTPEGKFFFLFSESGTSVALPLGYRINQASQPMHLDVTFPGANQTVKTIFELTADARLRLELGDVNPKAPRPTAFSSEAILFQKISDAATLPANTQIFAPKRETNKAGASEGKTSIAVMNRAQQAYYAKNSKFATTIEQLDQLGIGMKPETETYRYRIVRQGKRPESVMMTAQALRPGLKSYSAAVFVVTSKRKKTTLAGICETTKPASTPPAMPRRAKKGRKIQCPSGSRSLGRS